LEFSPHFLEVMADQVGLSRVFFKPPGAVFFSFDPHLDSLNQGRKLICRLPFHWTRRRRRIPARCSVHWSGEVLPPVTGDYVFKFQYNSNVHIYLAGQKLFDDWDQVDSFDLVHLKLIPTKLVHKVHLQAGQPVAVRLEYKDPGTLFYISIGVPVASVGLAWAPIDPPVNLSTYDAGYQAAVS
jgi:hypothetical protein